MHVVEIVVFGRNVVVFKHKVVVVSGKVTVSGKVGLISNVLVFRHNAVAVGKSLTVGSNVVVPGHKTVVVAYETAVKHDVMCVRVVEFLQANGIANDVRFLIFRLSTSSPRMSVEDV